MRYTKPTILSESKASPLIMGTQTKAGLTFDADPPTYHTIAPAYEVDE